MPTELVIAEDAGELAARAARLVASWIRAEPTFHIALAGGGTPRAMHQALAKETVPWARVHVYFGDERCVPADDPESNYRMARESLLEKVPIAPAQVHRMPAAPGDAPDREQAARDYERVLPARFDLVVLGMGEDGHTASLFPGAASLDERERRVLAVTGPKPPPDRLTITPPVIHAARRRLVLVGGAGKAEVLARVLEGPPGVYPAQLALDGTWVIDKAAASQLQKRTSRS